VNINVIQALKKVLKMFTEYDDILTAEEVMEMLYVGKNTVYALLKIGELKGFRIGRTWKIPK